MAEPTRFVSLEADAGGLPLFSTPSGIFDIPTTLMGGSSPIGFGSSPNFLSGAAPSFGTNLTGSIPGLGNFTFVSPGSMMGNTFLNSPSGLGPSGIDWNTKAPNWWETSTGTGTPDMSGFTLQNVPFQNVSTYTGTPSGGDTVTTAAAGDVAKVPGSDAIQLPTMTVTGTKVPNIMISGSEPSMGPSGPGILGGVGLNEALGGAVQLDPFYVSATKPQDLPTVTYSGQGQPTTSGTTGDTSGVTTLPTMTVTGNRVQTPTATTPEMMNLLNQATSAWGTAPVTLPPVTADTGTTPQVNPLPVTTSVPPITPTTNIVVPPQVTVPNTTNTPVTPTALPPTSTPPPANIGQTGTAGTTTTSTSSAMTERDLAKELAKTLPALQGNQAAIQKMYGDLYSQFMPKGLSQTEQGVIDQYTADLNRLQQRQAGILSPEDVRQSQQAAREAYGARGQVMGRGAIGAEILNREAIRQQREDQARAAMQQSYGNILNMSNLQTGNLFSPIASLISGTFNPLGAYPADVYGTNVNAQLAREIAQKNYEAAVKSAELSGSAQKQAGTTSAIGNIFGSLLPAAITAICWVAREVYGEDNPRWMLFRDWLFRHAPEWFFNLYINHGEAFAGWLKRNSWAKRPIRIWMDSRIRSMEKRQLVLKEAV